MKFYYDGKRRIYGDAQYNVCPEGGFCTVWPKL